MSINANKFCVWFQAYDQWGCVRPDYIGETFDNENEAVAFLEDHNYRGMGQDGDLATGVTFDTGNGHREVYTPN